jgi:protein required for attachment to host cells
MEVSKVSICVVVADASRARLLFAEYWDTPLTEYKDLVHPESRLREQDLVSDGTGSGIDSGGHGMHSMGHENSAHLRQAEDFAREVCAEIDSLRKKADLRRIYLVAPPRFLGQLRSAMNKQCQTMIAGETDKNLVTHDIEDIRSHLPKRI